MDIAAILAARAWDISLFCTVLLVLVALSLLESTERAARDDSNDRVRAARGQGDPDWM